MNNNGNDIQISPALSVSGITVSDNDGSGRRMADVPELEVPTMRREPPNQKTIEQYASIIDVLFQRYMPDHPRGSSAYQAGEQNCLLRLLNKIPGCGWLRGQFDYGSGTLDTRPSRRPRKAAQLQNGQCTVCQGDWPWADRFCTDLASQACEMQMEWREIMFLIDGLARRIEGDIINAQEPAQFAGRVDCVKDRASSVSTAPEQEILTPTEFNAFTIHNYRLILRYYRSRGLDLEDAQDLTQSAFMVLWRRRHEARDPKAFLKGVARHHYFAFLRERKSYIWITDTVPEGKAIYPDRPSDREEADSAIAKCKLKEELLAGMNALSENQRKVIQLIYIEGLSLRQTAARLGIKASSVQIHESRAIAALRCRSGRKLG